MNAGDPSRFGFKLCAKCRTWVMDVEPETDASGDKLLDEMGEPRMVCIDTKYCAHANDGPWCPVWGANRCAHRGECVGARCVSADRFEGKLLNREER